MRKTALTLSVLLAVAAALWLNANRAPAIPPDLNITFTNGGKTDFAQLRGSPLVLAFWSVNCPACLDEMPTLAQLHQTLQAKQARLIAVSIPQDPPTAILATLKAYRPDYPTAFDVRAEIATAVGGVDATPMTLLVDSQGRIQRRIYGKLQHQQVMAAITDL